VPEQPSALAERAMSFGPFSLFPAQQLLLEGDTPVRLGSRAFDILTALVESAGELVSKTASRAADIWPIFRDAAIASWRRSASLGPNVCPPRLRPPRPIISRSRNRARSAAPK
jgi:hypothetical protein